MGWGGWGGFLVITVSHPTFCCVGVGLWLRWGWAVTNQEEYLENKKLQVSEYDRDVLYSAELRAALNSVESSVSITFANVCFSLASG